MSLCPTWRPAPLVPLCLLLFSLTAQAGGPPQHLGEEDAEAIGALTDLAVFLDLAGRHAEAEPLHRQAVAAVRRAVGEEDTLTTKCDACLAFHLNRRGLHAEEEQVLRRALATQ